MFMIVFSYFCYYIMNLDVTSDYQNQVKAEEEVDEQHSGVAILLDTFSWVSPIFLCKDYQ